MRGLDRIELSGRSVRYKGARAPASAAPPFPPHSFAYRLPGIYYCHPLFASRGNAIAPPQMGRSSPDASDVHPLGGPR